MTSDSLAQHHHHVAIGVDEGDRFHANERQASSHKETTRLLSRDPAATIDKHHLSSTYPITRDRLFPLNYQSMAHATDVPTAAAWGVLDSVLATNGSKMTPGMPVLLSPRRMSEPKSAPVVIRAEMLGPEKSQWRRNSILRKNSTRITSTGGLKKSASVEFSLHQDEELRIQDKDRRLNESSPGRLDAPRRLTEEEKAELYKLRPDLEIGPVPFFKEQMEELRRRNERRVLFAILGGAICLCCMMVIYYIITTVT